MARVLLRKSQPGNLFVRGELVRLLQDNLVKQGISVGAKIDGIFGNDTEKAIKSWQASHNQQIDGVVTFDSWQQATGLAAPTLRERALQLTADFEGTGFGKIVGNFDGAWLTWGIIGFTLKHGELSQLILRIQDQHPDLLQAAFGQLLDELLDVMRTPGKQEAFANSISLGQNRYKVDDQWAACFQKLGEQPKVKEFQLERVTRYWNRGVADAAKFNLASELGRALCFDIAVQNGGIDSSEENSIRARLNQSPATDERSVRIVIADVIAEHSNPTYAEDVRQRKRTIATGAGTVHGSNYALGDWGLGDVVA
jgi:peptidoglycan hydrolase-like protein with peptidoglycan-binding domain